MPISSEQAASRRRLGLAIRAWMHRYQISQQVPHDWASHVGSEGPWNSQMSLATTTSDDPNKRLDPKANFWIGLARLNKAIAEKDLPGDLKRSSRDRLMAAEPFLTADNRVATATDLFSMFIGEQEVSEEYTTPKKMTDSDAEALNAKLRETFRARCLAEMATPKDVWGVVKERATGLGMTQAQASKLQSVLVDLDNYSPDELLELSVGPANEPLPMEALRPD